MKCDRCGKEIEWLRRGWKYIVDLTSVRGYRVVFLKHHANDPYAYSESKLTLCKDCGEAVRDFLFNNKDRELNTND
jgi:hypothetical protein